ncbi:MAG: PQQ-binding-like beta-propeller repeat protein [Planctomycetes bacterium]|nr:PQQ-binding-like beta-propeller repeat protein [Planctomycetota bacterium]
MIQRLLVLLVLGSVLNAGESLFARTTRGAVISQSVAARYGLTRSWFTQVRLDSSRDRIVSVTLDGDTMFVQTTGAVVHAIDTETGRTRWVRMIGRPRHPSMEVGANDKYVAVVNGTMLYLHDRRTGRAISIEGALWQRKIGGVAGAGPALTDDYVYVPMVNGRMEGYQIENHKKPPWAFHSAGRALTQPLVTHRLDKDGIIVADSIAWPTDRGHLYVGRPNRPSLRYRFEAFDEIVAAPAYMHPYLISAGADGYVNAIHERTGEVLWDFSAGDGIYRSPVVIGDSVYAIPKSGGMFCISSKTGLKKWWTPRVRRFLSGSDKRLYVIDHVGRIAVIDAGSGGRIDTLSTTGLDLFIANAQSDRIFVGNKSGLIQCLHEIGRDEPMSHIKLAKDAAEDDGGEGPAPGGKVVDQPVKPGNPFEQPGAAPAKDANPFDEPGKEPAEAANPFDDPADDAKPKVDKEAENPFG